MNMICSRCPKNAIYYCTCTKPFTLTCEQHKHENSSLHRQNTIYFAIPAELKEQCRKICAKAIKKTERRRDKSLESIHAVVQELMLLSKTIEEIYRVGKKNLIAMLKYLSECNTINTCFVQSEVEKDVLDLLRNKHKISVEEPLTKNKIIDHLNAKFIVNIERARSELDRQLQVIEPNQSNLDQVMNQKIFLAVSSTNYLYCRDLDNDSETNIKLDCTNFPFGHGFCLLPNNNLIIYGGAISKAGSLGSYNMSNKTLIINIKENTVREMANGRLKSDIGNGAYLNGEVYSFGGFDGICQELASSEKYTIDKDKWTAISNLPQRMGYTTSACLNNQILLANKTSEILYQYNPSQNSYSSLLATDLSNKILLSNNDYAFLIVDCGIYMYSDNWILLNDNSILLRLHLLAPYIPKGNYIYFLAGGYEINTGVLCIVNLYRLNLNTSELELIQDDLSASIRYFN